MTAQDPALLPTFPEVRNMSENQYPPTLTCGAHSRSTQKRDYVFDPDEVTETQSGLYKKYKK
jgi:hypothetical protein